MKTKLIKEPIFKIHVVEFNTSFWSHYVASNIEDALAMCREEYPEGDIWSIEQICTESYRRSTKTITVEV